jgi:hypothetical protein
MKRIGVKILLARMLRLDRTAPRISSARKLVPFLALPNGTSDILAVVRRRGCLAVCGQAASWRERAGWVRKCPSLRISRLQDIHPHK